MSERDEPRGEGLDAIWPAPEPGVDFVARTVARLDDPAATGDAPAAAVDRPRRPGLPRRPRRRAAVVAALAALALIAVVIAVVAGRGGGGRGGPVAGGPAQGSRSATERTTVQVGRRAVVVMHPLTVLAWSVAADGSADVHMTAGQAFFRVEPGGRFDVHTPSGDVHVTGTCFTITVTAGATGVEVHEGAVELHGGGNILALRPGERGDLGGAAPARRRPAARAAPPDPAAVVSGRAGATCVAPGRDDCYCPSDPRYFEADQALLDKWAANCRVRADLPPLSDGDAAPIDAVADQLGLGGAARQAFHAAAAETVAAAETRVREIYVAATGDTDGARTLDVDAMVEQIDTTRTLGEDARLRATLAKERAGHTSPVVDPAAMTPYEELHRLLVSLGDDFEHRVAQRLGAAQAGELRRRFGGWPGPDFDWIGCP